MLSCRPQRLFVMAGIAGVISIAAETSEGGSISLTVQNGTVQFAVDTNVPAISVKGKSNALEAKARLRRDQGSWQLENIEALVRVNTLATGMAIRDEHMRKHIFTTSEGNIEDLRFEAQAGSCVSNRAETSCQVAGHLSIRGISRPLTLPLKVREDGPRFKASGDAVVMLSTYGIERPSQLGVKTRDEVQVHFQFTAMPAESEATAGRVTR